MTKRDNTDKENPVKRTVDAFWATGKRESNEHTLRIAQSYGDEDIGRMESAIKQVDANSKVVIDLDHSNVHVVSETPPEKFVTSLSRAGYEVLEVF